MPGSHSTFDPQASAADLQISAQQHEDSGCDKVRNARGRNSWFDMHTATSRKLQSAASVTATYAVKHWLSSLQKGERPTCQCPSLDAKSACALVQICTTFSQF